MMSAVISKYLKHLRKVTFSWKGLNVTVGYQKVLGNMNGTYWLQK